MKKYCLTILLFLTLFSNPAGAETVSSAEHVLWNRTPVEFVIPVGKERMLTFPSAVELKNTDPNLTTDKIRILNNNGTLYMKTNKPFDPIRIAVVIKKTGEAVLVDVSSKEKCDDAPVEVVSHEKKECLQKQPAGASNASITYADLMRYAVRHLYAPKRLIYENPNIHRTPMYTTKSVNLIYSGDVMAMPLESWRGGGLYVTAVLLKTLSIGRVRLKPSKIIGSWLAVSFYPTNYIQFRSRHDRTVAFFISDKPFNDALNDSARYGT